MLFDKAKEEVQEVKESVQKIKIIVATLILPFLVRADF